MDKVIDYAILPDEKAASTSIKVEVQVIIRLRNKYECEKFCIMKVTIWQSNGLSVKKFDWYNVTELTWTFRPSNTGFQVLIKQTCILPCSKMCAIDVSIIRSKAQKLCSKLRYDMVTTTEQEGNWKDAASFCEKNEKELLTYSTQSDLTCFLSSRIHAETGAGRAFFAGLWRPSQVRVAIRVH